MKHPFKPLATALAASLRLAAIAAVPLAWDVRPGHPAPVMFDRYHGETLALTATFQGFGELPFSPGADVRLWYQTNGMGRAWWSAPATVRSNVLSAVWSPEMDPGSERVSLFFGAPSNAYAAAVLRLRASPGFYPNVINPPPTLVDLESGLAAFCATGTAFRAATIGTDTRWTDSTGCVWQVAAEDSPWVQTAGTSGLYFVKWYTEEELDGMYTTSPGWYIGGANFYPAYADDDPHAAKVGAMSEPVTDYDAEYVEFERIPAGSTNLVGRALSTDTTQTTDPSALLNDPALASARIVPDARPSAYWPNRQRVLRLGDVDTVVTADKAEAEYVLVPSPDRLLFVDEVTVDGGVTNFTFKTLRQYLDAVSPDTLREVLRGYLPVEGGGTVAGDVTVSGDVTVTGTLAAPSLLRVVTADIEANGFSVSNGVLRANSGLVVSNGMCRINCARAVIGIGTPRLHIEGSPMTALGGLTFGGEWDAPGFTFSSAVTNLFERQMQSRDFVSASNAAEIAAMPLVTPGYRLGRTLPPSVTGGADNGIITLRNGKVNVVADRMYSPYAVLALAPREQASRRLDILFDFTSSAPAFYVDFATFGENPVFLGPSDALSITAGTPRLVHMRQVGDTDRWIVSYEDLPPWNPPLNIVWEDEP